MKQKKQGTAPESRTDNISGILVVVLSLLALFLFLFGVFSREYRLLAVTIPVTVFTAGFLGLVSVLAWEYSKRQL
ncbi:MAG: hypothetical protein V1820_01155 [archaeon]